MATVGPEASRVSSCSVTSSSSAELTQRWISPQSAASAAADLLAEQQHLLGPRQADQPGQQPRGAGVGAEAAADERLPEHRVVGGDGEVGGQGQIAAEADGPALHAAHHGQLDVVDEFDHAVGGVRDAPNQIAGARPLSGAVGGHPVGAGAEIVARAADVDGAQGIVGRGVGQ